ncbi:MAG: recombinase family protein [Chloroflexi bacterium]|nr:recombinase family protein [Chloroflexota bacterium]
MSKRAVLYARVSTDNQADKGYSLPSQLDACRKYAERQGFEIVGEFQDDYTGTVPIERRPEGKKVYAMLSSNEADAIIAYTVDRLVRPPEEGDEWDFPVLIRGLARLSKEIHTCEVGKLKTDFASLLMAMLGAKGAGDERRKIIERTRRGRMTKAKGGKVVGGRCSLFGYRFTHDDKGKTKGMEVYEPEARTVRLIFKWYLNGDEKGKPLTFWQIAKKLTEMHVMTPSQAHDYKTVRKLALRKGIWNDSSIASNIVGNEAYAGTWRYGKRIGEKGEGGKRSVDEQIAVNVPPIVDRETWERAQAQRKHNAAMSPRNAKTDYLLRGLIKCSCGCNMSGQMSGAITKRYYRCIRRFYLKAECREKSVNAGYAEAYTWDSIRVKFSNLDDLWDELKAAQAGMHKEDEPKRAELEAAKEMIEEADRDIDEIAAALPKATGRVGDALQAKSAEANARYAAHVKRRDELTAELGARVLTDDSIADILQYARDVREGLDNVTFDDKRRILESLKVKVTVKGGKVDAVTGIISFCTPQSANRFRPNALRRAPTLRNAVWGWSNKV